MSNARTAPWQGSAAFAKAASWAGETRRINDERALDLLLARSAGGTRTLQKKGIALDNTWFIAPELATIEMGSTLELYETPDLGRVVGYYRKNILCIAEAPERTGVDRATIVARQLVGFKIAESERAIARHGYSVKGGGIVTSGGPGFVVCVAIYLAYVPTALAAPGTQLTIDCRSKDVPATVVSGKFYKRSY